MVAAAIIGGAVVSAGASTYASRQSSGAASSGANAANAEQARQYDQTRADFAPYRQVGQGALTQLARLYGLPTPTADPSADPMSAPRQVGDTMLPAGTDLRPTGPGRYDVLYGGQVVGQLVPGGRAGRFVSNGAQLPSLGTPAPGAPAAQPASSAGSPDMSVFTESPDYQFNLAEGQKALDRSLVARGRGLSGAAVREGTRYASGMASNEFGNFYNRLANLAGLGQTATGSTAAAGANAANNISQNNLFAAQARASGYQQQAQGINNAVQGGISNYMLYNYLKQ